MLKKFKKKKGWLFLSVFSLTASAGLCLVSCNDEEFYYPSEDVQQIRVQEEQSTINLKALYATHHTMNPDEAAEHAEEAARLFFGDNQNSLRSNKIRVVRDVKVLTKDKSSLRSGLTSNALLPDTMAYLFNFADSAGFAIICADDRVGCPVLACVDNGTLGDEIDNPGLELFLEDAQTYMEKSILDFEAQKDSLLAVADSMFASTDSTKQKSNEQLRTVYTGSYDIILGEEKVEPLLPTTWGQGSPYNNEAPICSGTTRMPAGCWATATGQLFAYWRYPKSIDGYTYDWEGMTERKNAYNLESADKKSVAKLMRTIGSHIGMNYGCDGSSANSGNALPWMKKLGYETWAKEYSWGWVKQFLDWRRPVLIAAKRSKIKFLGITWGYKNGHIWVIDGYKRTKTQYETYRIDTNKGTCQITSSKTRYVNTYLHNNWGWSGKGNGYYAEGCFNLKEAVSLDNPNLGSSSDNYRYNKEIYLIWR